MSILSRARRTERSLKLRLTVTATQVINKIVRTNVRELGASVTTFQGVGDQPDILTELPAVIFIRARIGDFQLEYLAFKGGFATSFFIDLTCRQLLRKPGSSRLDPSLSYAGTWWHCQASFMLRAWQNIPSVDANVTVSFLILSYFGTGDNVKAITKRNGERAACLTANVQAGDHHAREVWPLRQSSQ